MKTKKDPTGQGRNRRKASRAARLKLSAAQRKVKAMFKDIPHTVSRQIDIVNNQTTAVYAYDISPQETTDLSNAIQFTNNKELLESQRDMPVNWFWKDQIEPPYRSGTAEEVNTFNQAVVAAGIVGTVIAGFPVAQIPVEQILLSEPYRASLSKVYTSEYNLFKGLSENTSKQVIEQITLGVQAGESPAVIAGRINKRYEVAKTNADRIANTEVNKAYNDASMDTNSALAEAYGVRAGVIHISALITTTRATHAARHGNAYTVAQQLSWWNEGANRINCHCTTQSVLIDANGQLADSRSQDRIRAERSFFDK